MTVRPVKVIPLQGGGATFAVGAWLVARVLPDGSIRWITKDAPSDMVIAVEAEIKKWKGEQRG